MRRPVLMHLVVLAAASRGWSQPRPERCAPRVEASASVPPSTVARLAASVSSWSRASVPCPLVRLDLVGARLVMTVVLDDGRQVARVLPSLDDAMPTLVALTASPALPEGPAEPAAVDPVTAAPTAEAPAPPVEAPAPASPPPVVAAPPPAPVVAVAPTPPLGAPWRLRVGLGGGNTNITASQRWHASLDVDALRGPWAFGLRAGDDGSMRRRQMELGASLALSARRRFFVGRWEFDVGPAVSARWGFGDTSTSGPSVLVGAEASAAFTITPRWSVFVRVGGAATFSLRPTEVDAQPPSETTPLGAPVDAWPSQPDSVYATWGSTLGVRWTAP